MSSVNIFTDINEHIGIALTDKNKKRSVLHLKKKGLKFQLNNQNL